MSSGVKQSKITTHLAEESVTQGFVVAALRLAEQGCAVFPLVPEDKKPLTPNGFKDATTDKIQIAKWWEEHPHANIGIATGEASGLLVLDVDVKNGVNGSKELQGLAKHLGQLPPSTRIVNTPSGGRHIYFQFPREFCGTPLKNTLAKGVEIKGNGRYVVAPPSVINGVAYEVAIDELPAALPVTWVDACRQPINWKKFRVSGSRKSLCEQLGIKMADVIDIAPNARKTQGGYIIEHPRHGATGNGNLFVNTQDNLWCCYRHRAGGDPITWIAVREGFIGCEQAGKLDKETFKRCVQVLQREGKVPADVFDRHIEVTLSNNLGINERLSVTAAHPLNDSGNALRFIDMFGDKVRYVNDLNTWFVWNDARWVEDRTRQVLRLAQRVEAAVIHETGEIEAVFPALSSRDLQKVKEEYQRWARTTGYKNRLEGLLGVAQSDERIAIQIEQLDQDPFLLNVRNGTVNLRTGDLLPHRRQDLLTKHIPIDYDAEAVCDRWEQFLERVQPNPAVRSFLQRAVGASLIGLTVEELIMFLYGPPATGKSTFEEALGMLAGGSGGYSKTAKFSTFLEHRETGGSPREDLARLMGARIVLCNEVNKNTKWNAALINSISSGDKMVARPPYARHSIEFSPVFTPWFAGNHRPKCDYDELATFRRLKIVPFNVVIPADERDPLLKEFFKTDEEARKGILAWAIRGCLEYQRIGLSAPDVVVAATEEYRLSQNPLSEFIAEECFSGWDPIEGKPYEVSIKDLWERYFEQYQDYRIVKNEHSMGKYLTAAGFERFRDTRTKEWMRRGIRLKEGSDYTHSQSLQELSRETERLERALTVDELEARLAEVQSVEEAKQDRNLIEVLEKLLVRARLLHSRQVGT